MRARSRGFTLIEVIVAFVLLSLVLATGFEIFSTGLRRAGDLDGYSRAIVVAQSKIASAGLDVPVQAGTTEGQSEDGLVHWVLDMQPVEDEMVPGQPQPGAGTYMLFRVRATVDWPGPGDRRRTYSLSTLALGVRQ